jgi:protein involved in polysaccharide export with SLBB domain
MKTVPVTLISRVTYWSARALLFTTMATALLISVSRAAPPDPESTVGKSRAEIIGSESGAMTFAIGDRLKITLLENFRPELTRESVLSNLVERPEIAGEYVVQQDGKVFLPLLGAILVIGQTHAEFTQTVELDFKRLFGNPAKVIVQLVDREPIYVTGPVARPGTFKYVPGMSVQHALALAGGMDGFSTDQWRQLDLSRERERLQKSQERLRRLLALKEVLIAEREGNTAVPPPQLVDLAGRSSASKLVVEEQQLRTLESRRRIDQEGSLISSIEAIQRELRVLRERMVHSEASMKEKAEYVKGLSALRARGTVTDLNFHLAQSELSHAQERWHEVRTTIVQLERKLLETEQQKVRIGIDEEIKRERDIKTTQDAIADEQVSQTMLSFLLSGSPEISITADASRAPLQYRVLRRTITGLKQLASDQISMLETLEPGDILQVGKVLPDFQRVGSH